MIRSWNRASFSLAAATVASFFAVAGVTESIVVTLWIAATLYIAALAAYAKAKGRSFGWGLLGIMPFFGWIPLARLRDHSRDGGGPSAVTHRMTAGAGLRAGLVSLVGGAICTLCMLPQLVFWEARPHARRLIPPLEADREAHGVYPESLEPLAAAQEPPVSLGSIHYETYDEGRAFVLTLSNWDDYERYDSKTGKWKFGRF